MVKRTTNINTPKEKRCYGGGKILGGKADFCLYGSGTAWPSKKTMAQVAGAIFVGGLRQHFFGIGIFQPRGSADI